MSLETIPIPTDEARRKEPMRLEVYGLSRWPNQRFEIRFDWNEHMGKWIVAFEHLGTGTRFYKGPADLYQAYTFDEEIAFMFLDPSRQATAVTPSNLGESVWLAVLEVS